MQAYIPLPDADQRKQILSLVLSEENVFLDFDDSELKLFASTPTEGLSGSDLVEVCRQAALERLKEELKGQTGLQ
ncbi:unnamed protein product [Protopolystoma xenopodis]|uniref:AAA ATPase AAA+ lid domain-containing protein n=1 Tax=Protopolystoma xenopodis TaxID=117903 RepID=A0A3S5CV32_9PLAT|nr:unnamed protein product [Protopolystoma xenopodis]